MKRFNKILALVLAMTMMFSLVSTFALAANTTDASYKIEFADNDGNAITSVASGSMANVIVSIKTNGYAPAFAFRAIYDATALTHIRAEGTKVQTVRAENCAALIGRFANTDLVENPSADLVEHEDDEIGVGKIYDWGSAEPSSAPHSDLMYPTNFTQEQKDQFKCINFGYLANSGKTCLTVNTEGEYVPFVRFRFMAAEDTVLNESIFYFENNPLNTYIAIDPDDEPFSNLQASAPVVASNLVVEYEGGVTPPPVQDPITVENIPETQVQWQDKAAGKMRVAFRGNIKGYDANADKTGSGDELAKLTEVGVVFSKTDETPTLGEVVYKDGVVDKNSPCKPVPAYTIYDFTSGGYFYRAVVGSVSHDSTEKLYANAYIIFDGTTFTATNAVISTTGAQAYTDGVAKGMAAK